jgi:hypothetical protein
MGSGRNDFPTGKGGSIEGVVSVQNQTGIQIFRHLLIRFFSVNLP